MREYKKYYITLPGGELYEIERPLVMGVINVTDDSVYESSRVTTNANALRARTRQLIEDGADMIDVGACSTRPGSEPVALGEEIDRLLRSLPIIKEEAEKSERRVPVSVDSYRSAVVKACHEAVGIDIVNDISGGTLDDSMWQTVARLRLPYVLTHVKGTPRTMAAMTDYRDGVAAEVLEDMAKKLDSLRQMGVNDVIVDPGFGFAKTIEQNYQLASCLELFHSLNAPLLVGFSRKKMITEVLGCRADEALNGTTVLNTVALLAGAHILRVHDAKEACEAVRLIEALRRNSVMINKIETIDKSEI